VTNAAVIRPISTAFFTEHVLNLAKLFTRWRLRGLELEIVPVNAAATGTYALGFTNDPALSFSSGPSTQQIMSLGASEIFNLASVSRKQVLRYIPSVKNEWKYVSQDSETTAAEVRQCAAGELWCSWSISVPTTGRYADIFVHFDVEFKDPVSNLNLSLKRPEEKTSSVVLTAVASSTASGISTQVPYPPTPQEIELLRLRRQSVATFPVGVPCLQRGSQ